MVRLVAFNRKNLLMIKDELQDEIRTRIFNLHGNQISSILFSAKMAANKHKHISLLSFDCSKLLCEEMIRRQNYLAELFFKHNKKVQFDTFFKDSYILLSFIEENCFMNLKLFDKYAENLCKLFAYKNLPRFDFVLFYKFVTICIDLELESVIKKFPELFKLVIVRYPDQELWILNYFYLLDDLCKVVSFQKRNNIKENFSNTIFIIVIQFL